LNNGRVQGGGRALGSLLLVGLVTVFGMGVLGREDVTNITLFYLFGIAGVSLWLGYRPSLLAALSGALCLDYFFLPPYGTFIIGSAREIVTFTGLFATAVFISTLNEKLRKQARAARQNERRMEFLYGLTRELIDATSVDDLSARAATQIELATNQMACVLIRRGETFSRAVRSGGAAALETEDLGAASWAAAHLEPAGLGTRNCSEARACYVPLIAARGCIGVLSLRPREQDRGALPRPSSLVLSMARQLALALERALLSEEKQAAQIEVETERVRNAVLSSVSHDLRSPLAVIASASSTLAEHGERLQVAARVEMSRIIHEEARRLNELLKSLLDVTRLQSGGLKVSREWESLEEVVGSVLRRVDERSAGRHLRANVPSDLPLLQLDAILVEQVLLNLVDNAFKHSHTEQAVDIDVGVRGDEVVVSVIDHGKGIADDEISRIFEKFYRSDDAPGGGLGLGLTLARGIVQAHGGRIWASHTPGGGLTVQFTLPLSAAPPRLTGAEASEGVSTQRRV
jgi:two-component system, OmpR family, sensor histidine kinase KdpD